MARSICTGRYKTSPTTHRSDKSIAYVPSIIHEDANSDKPGGACILRMLRSSVVQWLTWCSTVGCRSCVPFAMPIWWLFSTLSITHGAASARKSRRARGLEGLHRGAFLREHVGTSHGSRSGLRAHGRGGRSGVEGLQPGAHGAACRLMLLYGRMVSRRVRVNNMIFGGCLFLYDTARKYAT